MQGMARTLGIVVSCASALAPTPVWAQAEPVSSLPPVTGGDQASADTVPDEINIGEIVVTAQKREQKLQDVGISVSAYSGEQLRALGITEATQITQQIPALQINAWSPNITIFNLRGISQNNFTDNLEAPVAVYLDDAYMGSINGISGQLFDIERVEVLRGPQGTLFGRNATGGLIHYISRDASEDGFNGYGSASYERFDRVSVEGAAGGSLIEGIRFRVAARYERADGYIKSADAIPGALLGNGQDLGGANGWAARGTIQADLGSNATVDLWFKHSEDNDVDTGGYVFDNCVFEANGYCQVDAAGLTNGTTGVINGVTGEKASPYSNFSNDIGFLDRRTNILQGKLSWNLAPRVELTAITNYTNLKKSYGEDGDAIPVTVIQFLTTAKYRQFSQELRLSGSSPSFRWQAGAYYLDINLDGTLTTIGAPIFNAAVGLNGSANNPRSEEVYALDSRNWSIFGQAEYDVTSSVTLIGGLRYSKDSKDIDYISTLADPPFPTAVIGGSAIFAAANPGVDRIRHGDWAARASVNYHPSDDLLLFASYNRGIKGGNWTLSPNVTADNFRHAPETLNSLETGFKFTSKDRHIRLNGTIYHYLYDDYQAFGLVGGTPQVTNSDATATGGELEFFWNPSPRFNAILGGTYQTSRVKRVAAVGTQFGPELFPGAPDAGPCINRGGFFECNFATAFVRNAELPNAPEFSFNYLARYNFDALGGNIALQVDGAWYDDQYLEVTNGRSSLQKAYNVTNGSVTWTSADERFDVTLFGRNVLDKAYRAYTLNLGILGTTSYYAPPITYGVRAGFRW